MGALILGRWARQTHAPPAKCGSHAAAAAYYAAQRAGAVLLLLRWRHMCGIMACMNGCVRARAHVCVCVCVCANVCVCEGHKEQQKGSRAAMECAAKCVRHSTYRVVVDMQERTPSWVAAGDREHGLAAARGVQASRGVALPSEGVNHPGRPRED